MSDPIHSARLETERTPTLVLGVVLCVALAATARLALPVAEGVRAAVAWIVAFAPVFLLLRAASARGAALGAASGLLALTLAELLAAPVPGASPRWEGFLVLAGLYLLFSMGALAGSVLSDRPRSDGAHGPSRAVAPPGEEPGPSEPGERDGVRADGADPLPRDSVLGQLEALVRERPEEGASEPIAAIVLELSGLGDQSEGAHREVWRAIVEQLGETHLFGRLGEERFLVVLPGRTAGAASAVAERIRANLAPIGTVTGSSLTLGAGVAAVNPKPGAGVELLSNAEQALEHALHLGGDRVIRKEGGAFGDAPVRPYRYP